MIHFKDFPSALKLSLPALVQCSEKRRHKIEREDKEEEMVIKTEQDNSKGYGY